jgi:uncharacterized DUF497 family protein
MKEIRWNEEKNQLLILQRGLSFEEVMAKIEAGDILERMAHPNHEKYPHQELFVLELKDYICYVPFVEGESELFLKTIIPSRKLNKTRKGKL